MNLEPPSISTKTQSEPVIELGRDEVAHRARQLWQAAGQPTGRNLEYWLQAELELVSERRPRPNRAPARDGP